MAKSKPGPELHAAINAAMNEWGAAQGLPAMKWRRAESFDSDVSGMHPSGNGTPMEAEAARSWGHALGFQLNPYSDDVSGIWSGTIDDWDIDLDYGPNE